MLILKDHGIRKSVGGMGVLAGKAKALLSQFYDLVQGKVK
jgi:hypothetical protein